MCGICGVLAIGSGGALPDSVELARISQSMQTRGPDGEGMWRRASGNVALAHRRLAVIDLSDAGLQPMHSACGRYTIVFNGEIYNFAELKSELRFEGHSFGTSTDTEVILELFGREREKMLRRLRGMFAFAIWDDDEKSLFLARDPYGIKPLYYSTYGRQFRFASQIRALEAGGAIPGDVDVAGLVGFLLWGSVPEPRTIRRHIQALPAGCWMTVSPRGATAPVRYDSWGTLSEPVTGTLRDAVESTVRAHLVSDVPVAVFLSAGLDSSLIAAVASRLRADPLDTITLRFDEYAGTAHDEAPFAREIAARLGTRHHELAVGRSDFHDLWPAAMRAMDQPSIDGLNTFVISQAAHRAGFKVALSGLGGDELFGGYASFRDLGRWLKWNKYARRIPGVRAAWPWLSAPLAGSRPKIRDLLSIHDLADAYYLRRGLYLPHELPRLIGASLAEEGLSAYDPRSDLRAIAARERGLAGQQDPAPWLAAHIFESRMFMKNQLLRDCDWASMAHSLELRVPLVDAWLRDAVARLDYEPGRSGGKRAVVRETAPELPAALFNRPKTGFSIPVTEWLESDVSIDTPRGLASRTLALRVLAGFGIELDSSEVDPVTAGGQR